MVPQRRRCARPGDPARRHVQRGADRLVSGQQGRGRRKGSATWSRRAKCRRRTRRWSEWAAIGRCIAENHSVIGYEKVLKLGFEGILKEVERCEAENGPRDMYSAMKLLRQAGCEFERAMPRRRAICSRMRKNTETRKQELQKIAETCSQVPAKPARSFMEAIQSLWFAHIMNTWEDSINANSLGRLDQILYPYYTADIEKGLLTKEEAFELDLLPVDQALPRLRRAAVLRRRLRAGRRERRQTFVHAPRLHNGLSFHCLSVRYSQRTDKAFLKRALEVVGHVQKGVPFFFNDDVMIPALMAKGIPLRGRLEPHADRLRGDGDPRQVQPTCGHRRDKPAQSARICARQRPQHDPSRARARPGDGRTRNAGYI